MVEISGSAVDRKMVSKEEFSLLSDELQDWIEDPTKAPEASYVHAQFVRMFYDILNLQAKVQQLETDLNRMTAMIPLRVPTFGKKG